MLTADDRIMPSTCVLLLVPALPRLKVSVVKALCVANGSCVVHVAVRENTKHVACPALVSYWQDPKHSLVSREDADSDDYQQPGSEHRHGEPGF